jgi:hypothetical protein
VAPHTTQRAALYEKSRPNAWPVVDGKPFDVEYIHLPWLFGCKVSTFLPKPQTGDALKILKAARFLGVSYVASTSSAEGIRTIRQEKELQNKMNDFPFHVYAVMK